MKQYLVALFLLCSAGIIQADRIVRVIEEPDYEDTEEVYDYEDDNDNDNNENDEYETPSTRVRYYQRPVIKKTVYIQRPSRRLMAMADTPSRVVYVQPRPVRHIVYRRPVCVYRNTSCGSTFVSGLVGFGLGTALGTALAR